MRVGETMNRPKVTQRYNNYLSGGSALNSTKKDSSSALIGSIQNQKKSEYQAFLEIQREFLENTNSPKCNQNFQVINPHVGRSASQKVSPSARYSTNQKH